MKSIKRSLLYMFLLAVMLLAIPTQASAAVTLNKTTVTLTVGQNTTLKVKGTKKKAKWSSNKKSVATVSSSGKVTAKKKGSATITAKIGSKKYKCKVTVKNPVTANGGDRAHPLSAYAGYNIDVYNYSEKIGKFGIKLLDYKDGDEAEAYIMRNDEYGFNQAPSASQEYIYVKFEIKYLSGEKDVDATDVINHYSNFFNSKANYQLDNIDWAYNIEDEDSMVDDMVDVNLYPGGSAICSKAILVRAGNTPITYRIQTGYDKNEYEPIYTWFTTKR